MTSGVDKIMFGISLPADSVVHGFSVMTHVVNTGAQSHLIAMMYAIQAYILPILDPDAGSTFQLLWDNLVPKDDDVDTIDLDTGGNDPQSFFEPGESSFAEILDLGLQPQRVWHEESMLSYANAVPQGESPVADVFEYIGVGRHRMRSGKRYRVSQPSALVFALGVAAMDDTTATEDTVAAEDEWFRLKHIETMIEQALVSLFGLTEAGATVTWDTAAALLRKHLEPDVFEEDATAWGTGTLRVFTRAVIDMSVPGTLDKITLGTGG